MVDCSDLNCDNATNVTKQTQAFKKSEYSVGITAKTYTTNVTHMLQTEVIADVWELCNTIYMKLMFLVQSLKLFTYLCKLQSEI